MAEVASLLKPNATPWMRAVEAASAPAWPAPAHLITDFHDPWRCPSHLLYALALENSVDIWSDDWADSKKRSVIARSVELHRLKGTLAGIKAYAEIAGGQVKRAISPPQGVYAGGDQEATERAAWLSRFPEFRLFTHEPWAIDLEDAYAGEAFAGGSDDAGCYPPTNPADRIHTRAGVLIQDGVEFPMTRREQVQVVDGVEQLVERFTPTAVDGTSAFGGQAWPGDYLDSGATLPTLTLVQDLAALGAPGSTRTFRGPFLESRPERVGATAADPAGGYADIDFLDAAFLDPGLDPAVLSFDRWRLADPRRSAGAVAPGDSFFGDADLLSLPAFTLLLDVQVDETAPRATAFAGGFEGDYPDAVDTARTDLVLEAISAAADDCDRVLVRFARHRPKRLTDRPTLPFRLGQLVADF